MTPLEAARRHLTKAQEFLAEADSALASGRANVATSNAVIAGINAKDAICLVLVGKTAEADEGGQAHVRLRDTGEVPQCRRAVISGAGEKLLGLTMEQALGRGTLQTAPAGRPQRGQALPWSLVSVAEMSSDPVGPADRRLPALDVLRGSAILCMLIADGMPFLWPTGVSRPLEVVLGAISAVASPLLRVGHGCGSGPRLGPTCDVRGWSC